MTHDGLGKYLKEKITKAPGADRRHRRHPPGHPDRRRSSATCRSAPSRRPSGTSSRPWPPASASSTACRSSSPARTTGTSASRRPACRSSATTSSRRSAPPSSTASSPGCSPTAACAWSAPASSTSAATWTSTTCSSASGWSRRRSPRPTPSPRSWTTSCPRDDVYIGPSDYVPWLTDRKWAHIRVEGRSFGDVPLNLELKLEVWDSPNSAGIVIDAVRTDQAGAEPRHRRASSTAPPAT